ncbi:MAG: phytoene desaturase family protein, partial [Promethearchaeota archaeon]
REILKELDLEEKLDIKRYDPSDIIITPDYKISFWNDIYKTIREFQDNFPNEAINIKNFFEYVLNFNALSSASLVNKNFEELLNQHFKNRKLKAVLSLPILGNAGLPPSMISAFPAVMLYKEFVLDGGYYPKNGMQDLPDKLTKRFQEFGGSLMFKQIVNKIEVKNKSIEGIRAENGKLIRSKCVVSGIDGRSVFLKLLGEDVIDKSRIKKIKKMVPSLSAVSLYIGLKKPLKEKDQVNLWYLPVYDIERIYSLINSGEIDHEDMYYTLFHHGNTVCLFINAPYRTEKYWIEKKEILINNLINKIKKSNLALSNNIKIQFMATPITLFRQTLNYQGATYGWAALRSQYLFSNLSKFNPVKNLYLTGHWTSLAFGVSGVAYLGRNTAEKILNKIEG